MFDVEQADATIFVSPSGQTLLVDRGKNRHGSRIKAVMRQAGVSTIDHFVATHYHEDHYGGIDDLHADPEITIDNAHDRGDKAFLPDSKTSQQTFIDYQVVAANADQLIRGETIPLDRLMNVLVVSAGGVVIGEEPPVTAQSENDASVSLLITFGAGLDTLDFEHCVKFIRNGGRLFFSGHRCDEMGHPLE